jgi:hypothetical protein
MNRKYLKGESMRNWLNAASLFLITLFLAPSAHAATDAAACLGCHGSMEGALKVDQEKFSKSVHGGMNDCTMCHLTLKGAQHQGLSEARPDKTVVDLASALSPKSGSNAVAQAACVNCHAEPYQAYKTSVHGRNIIEKKSKDGPVCTDCHGSPHSIMAKAGRESAVNHFNIVESCGKCHEEKIMSEKYGFSTHVMERYKESFHGRKLKVGHPGSPSCANCHGSHEVKSAKDQSSPVSAANKIKTCNKCHEGATDKFVAAITHKPMHPIAHFTEIALIVLTVGTFMFICIHVLLDIFADIRERLFKKGDQHE